MRKIVQALLFVFSLTFIHPGSYVLAKNKIKYHCNVAAGKKLFVQACQRKQIDLPEDCAYVDEITVKGNWAYVHTAEEMGSYLHRIKGKWVYVGGHGDDFWQLKDLNRQGIPTSVLKSLERCER
jgi:hypothetical protein